MPLLLDIHHPVGLKAFHLYQSSLELGDIQDVLEGAHGEELIADH